MGGASRDVFPDRPGAGEPAATLSSSPYSRVSIAGDSQCRVQDSLTRMLRAHAKIVFGDVDVLDADKLDVFEAQIEMFRCVGTL